MKNTTSQILKRTTFYSCLLFISLLFINCNNDDDTQPPTYEFGEKFKDIEDLPVVVDEDLATPDPDAGKVAESEKTLAIIPDILGASTEAEVSADTKSSLNTIKAYTASQPIAVVEAAESLGEAGIDAILDQSVALNATLSDLQASLDGVSDEVAALLPNIQLSTDFERSNISAQTKAGIIVDLNDADIFSQAQTGPCHEAARDAYNDIIADLTGQRDANLAIVDANYTRRQSEADARLETRIAVQAILLEDNKTAVKTTILSLLDAAEYAEIFLSMEIASEIRQLTLYYAVYARTALDVWNTAVLEILESFNLEEKAAAEEHRNNLVAQETAFFETTTSEAQAILNGILNNCHNQGSGN